MKIEDYISPFFNSFFHYVLKNTPLICLNIFDMKKHYAVFDLKAFYATFECVERELDPFLTPLAVTDTTRKESTIVLSVSPYLKSLGVPSRCRVRELPKNIPNMILAMPQMEKYVKASAKIFSIMLDFVAEDDIHIYSIDECFIYLTPYLKLHKCTPLELCKKIIDRVYEKTKLILTCGIGPNMFLAKVCNDKEGKNKKVDDKYFLAERTKEDIPTKLWPIKPLSELWGISIGYQKRLNNLGIYSVYDLAHYDKNILVKLFGVMGEELHNNANGIDETDIREKYIPINKNLTLGQVLMRDYTKEEIKLIIKEMIDDLTVRLRKYGLYTELVSLSIRYSFEHEVEGFSRQVSLMTSTDINSEIYQACIYLLDKYCLEKPIRQVAVALGKLSGYRTNQINMFSLNDKEYEKEKSQLIAMDKIKEHYGDNSVLRTSSLSSSSTAKYRHNQIGGHKK